MSLFQKNYNKPGKGVEKDAPPAPGILRVWQLFFRNFNKMLLYGLVLALVTFPLLIAATAYTAMLSPEIAEEFRAALEATTENPAGQIELPNVWIGLALMAAVWVSPAVWVPLLCVCALLYGPLTCGLFYCLRNHAREEHVWFSDIFVRAWRNKWQGLFFGLLDIFITLSMLMYLFAAEPRDDGSTGLVFVLQVLSVAIFAVYMVMRWYIYQMIVTFNLKLSGILKNAWMFVILGLGRNVMAGIFTLLLLAFFFVFPVLFPAAFPMFLVLTLFFSGSIISFSQVFFTYPVMHRYLVAPALAEEKKKTSADEQE